MSDSAGTAVASRGDDARGPDKQGRPNPFARLVGYPRQVITRLMVFFRQVVAELRKVIWPTKNELITYTSVVLVFVVVMVSIVAVFDLAFTKAVLFVFGQ